MTFLLVSATFRTTDFQIAEGCSFCWCQSWLCNHTDFQNSFQNTLTLFSFFLLSWKMSGEGIHVTPFFCTEHLCLCFWSNVNAQNWLQTGNGIQHNPGSLIHKIVIKNQQGFVSVDGRTMHSWLSCNNWIKFYTDDCWYDVRLSTKFAIRALLPYQ